LPEERLPEPLKLLSLKPEPLPLAELNDLPVVSMVAGTRVARVPVRRKLSGRSRIGCSEMVVPTPALVASTKGAAPCT